MPETYLLLCGKDNLNEGWERYGQLFKNAGVKVEVCYEKEALHGFIENHFNYEQIPFTTKDSKYTYTERSGGLPYG